MNLDVALRLSSDVHDLGTGFCFGRNQARCDILLTADDDAKRVSNMHFKIYLTGDGIIMLKDTSTNGTIVDNCRLRKDQKEASRMLTNGSVIQVLTGTQGADEVRFVVRVLPREGFAMQYTRNMIGYFERAQKAAAGTAHHGTRAPASALSWSVANTYGMHWTGGSVYNVTGQIGKGAFATVYKLATKQHGSIFAAKELDKRRFMKNGILDQKVDNEMKIMRDLKHVSQSADNFSRALDSLSISQTLFSTSTTTNTTVGSILSWNTFLAESCRHICRVTARSQKTW